MGSIGAWGLLSTCRDGSASGAWVENSIPKPSTVGARCAASDHLGSRLMVWRFQPAAAIQLTSQPSHPMWMAVSGPSVIARR